jgi:hypothetical protein
MKELGHTYIDVLKIDIEGAEFPWLRYEGSKILPRVGQVVIELHVHTVTAQQYYPKEDSKTFIETMEIYDYRLFHVEVNRHAPLWGSEFSLIQKKWIQFENNKKALLPL